MKKVFIDTNILLRHLLQDVPAQSAKATKIIEDLEQDKYKGYISILVVNEALWILQGYYHMKRTDYIPQIRDILSLGSVKIPEMKKDHLFTILQHMEQQNIDFTDLYLFYTAGKTPIISFDKDFEKLKK